MSTPAHQYAKDNHQAFVDSLIDLLKIPSISTDSVYKGDVQQAAEWVADDMRRIGLENVEIIPTAGHPTVYGDWLHAGDDKPTVLIYGHYDVQPADEIQDKWSAHPFKPYIEDGKLFARGSTDDKGQVMIQLKAAESLLATGGSPVNLKYIIEGEEEVGSPNMDDFIQQYKDKLSADLCVISDTQMRGIDLPSMFYSVRGLVTMELIVSGPKNDLHSGLGGTLHNPAQALTEIVAALHTPDGKIAVPGFYDDVRALSDEERAQLAHVNELPAQYAPIIGDVPEYGEPGFNRIERMGARPTLEINGIAGGYAGEGFKTVIPATAIAKISCRLVADQNPDKIYQQVSDFIHTIAPNTVRVETRYLDGAHAAITPIDSPYMQAATRAIQYHWDQPVIFERGGGSLPIVASLQNQMQLPVVLLGFGLPDAKAHGPDENFYLEMYARGIDCVIQYMHELANLEG